MPFAKRIVEPQFLCRLTGSDEQGSPVQDLCAISNVALSRTLRQLSDLAKHACALFQELEHELLSTNRRVWALRDKISGIQETTDALDPRQEAVPVSNLHIESKLNGHYQTSWQLQRNMFLPSTRPACVTELHRSATQSLRALYRDQQQRQEFSDREQRVFISMSPPISSTCSSPCTPRRPEHRDKHLTTDRTERDTETQSTQTQFSSSPSTECCQLSLWSRQVSPPDDLDTEVATLGHRPKCPIPNVPTALDKQTNWPGVLPLPTPEEKMKADSQAVTSCIVPINVTEEAARAASPSEISAFIRVAFDREASVRCSLVHSLVHSQSVLQRRRKLRRRKTITGIPRAVRPDLDSDESPVARERSVIVHTNPDACHEDLVLSPLNTRDSGCQTEEFLAGAEAAPSRRRIRAQRGQAVTVMLSHSAGNISSLPDTSDPMFTASVGTRLRSRSLPRDGGQLVNKDEDDSDENDDEEEEEFSPFEAEDFLRVSGKHILKDDEASRHDQTVPERTQHIGCTEHDWMDRSRSTLPRTADMGSCEISSSSDTFSPVHSVSNAGVLTSQLDHKEDHQSSSGNWSGSSSTCPSQTSEIIPPAASPPLTGSSHGDSELSLNAATNTNDDSVVFISESYPGDRSQCLYHNRTGFFTSTAIDMLDDAGVSTASEGEWKYPHYRHNTSCPPDFSPEHSRCGSSLECPSFTSIATFESLMERSPSEKADNTSHYSVDAEGFYTSMHFDCGLKGSKSFTYNYASVDQQQTHYIHQTKTLGRHSLSLRKPKVKPSPPKRSSSLKKISSHDGFSADKNELQITVGLENSTSSREKMQHVELNGTSGQLESEEPLGPWDVERSTEIPEIALFCSTETHSFKDEGAVQSDYADLWLLNDLKASDPYRSLSNSSTATGTTVIECIKSQDSSETQTSHSGSRATTSSLSSVENGLPSPEKLISLASPSSGYSSQSETPTSSLPSAFFSNAHPMSPISGKRKPKVPERKSSLSSLQRCSSKRDLELPAIPPTHLDLSALSNVNKPSVHRKQMHIIYQSRQKSAAETKGVNQASDDEPAITSPLTITPMVLCSVQLRSVGKSATRPKCPTVTIITPHPQNKPHDTRKPPPYRPLLKEASFNTCESLFTPVDGLAAKTIASHFGAQNRYDRLAPSPLYSMTSLAQSERGNMDDVTVIVPENPESQKGKAADEVSTSKNVLVQSNLELVQNQFLRSEFIDGSPSYQTRTENSSGQSNIAKRSDSLDQVPKIVCQRSETLQAYSVSGAVSHQDETSARSASLECEEGSTPDTEDYFSKESTPSDASVSPLTDESKPEDDGVFLSPSKSRTTEDLFAMIHRSKRKLLGRKDSGDMTTQSRLGVVLGNGTPATLPSSPNSPTNSATQTGSQKALGQIYRSAKKSSTSNEEFKLLLLKKGSRSDSSYRMSATEILKSPISTQNPGEPLMEGSRPLEDPLSPLQHHSSDEIFDQILSPFPKTYAESFTTKAFSTSASSRQGRSRMPPAANSSRYSTRSRLYSTPMQVISEGETENSDGSPHDDRSS